MIIISLLIVFSMAFGLYAIFADGTSDNEGTLLNPRNDSRHENGQRYTYDDTAYDNTDRVYRYYDNYQGQADGNTGDAHGSTSGTGNTGYTGNTTGGQASLPTNLSLTQAHTRDLLDTRYLALVNHNHPAPHEPKPGTITPAWPTVAVSRIDGMYLHQSALRAVSEMFATALQLDAGAFFVSSGFRDIYHQAYLYGDGSNSDLVMPPGYSEHQTGLAVDILVVGLGMWCLVNAPEGLWLAANSYRYGLILRYPQGAEYITGVQFEPWHFRYVGSVHAYFMNRHDLVLEEYIQYIREQGQISIQKGGNTYYVFHQVPQDGIIYVPEETNFLVSGDNKGGYIIWTTM